MSGSFSNIVIDTSLFSFSDPLLNSIIEPSMGLLDESVFQSIAEATPIFKFDSKGLFNQILFVEITDIDQSSGTISGKFFSAGSTASCPEPATIGGFLLAIGVGWKIKQRKTK